MKTITLAISVILFSTLSHAKFGGALPDAPDLPVIVREAFKRLSGNNAAGAEVSLKCKYLTDSNKAVLSDIDPTSGFPYASSVNSPFWAWYFGCLEEYLKKDIRNSPKALKNATGPKGAEIIGSKSIEDLKGILWKNVNDQAKIEMATSILSKIVNLDVLKEFGVNIDKVLKEDMVKRSNEFNPNTLNFIEAINVMINVAMKQKEFLVD